MIEHAISNKNVCIKSVQLGADLRAEHPATPPLNCQNKVDLTPSSNENEQLVSLNDTLFGNSCDFSAFD